MAEDVAREVSHGPCGKGLMSHVREIKVYLSVDNQETQKEFERNSRIITAV